MAEQEKPENTYFLDPESTIEMARLIEQDRTLTKAMGGALAGLPELPVGAQILDLGCGPGSWVLDAAYAQPDSDVAGVDISHTMIEYANARARSQNCPNASFGVMNITKPLDFSDDSFDFVNARALIGVLYKDAWLPFIAECTRILKPGGILRLTEPADFGVTNSVAIERLLGTITRTVWQLGYGFSVDGHSYGLLPVLPAFLREAGYQQVHTLGHICEFSAGTPAWIDFYRNYEVILLQGKPHYIKTGTITAEQFDQDYQQMFIDMNQPDFRGLFTLVSVIGIKPASGTLKKRRA